MIRFPSIKSSPPSDSFAPVVVNVDQSIDQALAADRDEGTDRDGERSFRLDRSSPKLSSTREHSSKESPPRSARSGSPGTLRPTLPKIASSSPNSSKMYRELILPKLVVHSSENNSTKEDTSNNEGSSLSTREYSYGGGVSMTSLTASDHLSSDTNKATTTMKSQSRPQLPNLDILTPDAGNGVHSFDETATPWLNAPSSARLLPMISRLNIPSLEIPTSTYNQKTGSYSVPLRRLQTLGIGSPFLNNASTGSGSDDATCFRPRSPSDPQGEELLIKANMRKHAMTPARIRRVNTTTRLTALSPLLVKNETAKFFSASPILSNMSTSIDDKISSKMQFSPVAMTENLSEKEVQEFIQEAVFLANSSTTSQDDVLSHYRYPSMMLTVFEAAEGKDFGDNIQVPDERETEDNNGSSDVFSVMDAVQEPSF